jgi:hypothetical protein
MQVPVTYWEQRLWVRVSAQLYNKEADYLRLAATIVSWRPPAANERA